MLLSSSPTRHKAKRDADWRYGPVRDNERRLNPFVVEWEKLPEPGRESNRATIRRLPAILARADFEIRETGQQAISK